MKRYQKIFLILSVFLICAGTILFYLWKRGTPYQTPFYSPNGQYYAQKYHNITLSSFAPAMPGNGSDNIDGYIRIYDKDGNLLYEKFYTYLVGHEVHWHRNTVFVMGSADDEIWTLPSSAE